MSMISRRHRAYIAALAFGCLAAPRAEEAPVAQPPGCAPGAQALFYAPRARAEWLLPGAFADSLWGQLAEPARELGYCLTSARDSKAVIDTAGYGDNLYLQASARDEGSGSVSISVAALRVRELMSGKLPEAESRPLVYLRFSPAEAAGLASVLAKKVAENLRNQYVAVLLIRSNPAGAAVRSANGLEGATPVEWVVPLGSLSVTLAKPGFMEAKRELDLQTPGQHTYDLQLAKRRFYHSKFIYPALAAGAISAAAFALENYYYGVYQDLGEADSQNRPAAFGQNFRTAKNYERIGYASLGLAAFSLALCFTF